MTKTASIYTRVEPELKEQVEEVLSRLGMPMSNAINLFLRQVVLQQGLPFDVKLPGEAFPPGPPHLDISRMSKEEFDAMMQEALDDVKAGRTTPIEEVIKKFEGRYGELWHGV